MRTFQPYLNLSKEPMKTGCRSKCSIFVCLNMLFWLPNASDKEREMVEPYIYQFNLISLTDLRNECYSVPLICIVDFQENYHWLDRILCGYQSRIYSGNVGASFEVDSSLCILPLLNWSLSLFVVLESMKFCLTCEVLSVIYDSARLSRTNIWIQFIASLVFKLVWTGSLSLMFVQFFLSYFVKHPNIYSFYLCSKCLSWR